MAVSAKTQSVLTTALKQSHQSGINLKIAFERAVKLAYSADDMDECNYIIQATPDSIRRRAVSFFKKFGIVVIENRGELPRADRVEDKSIQRKVIDKMKTIDSIFNEEVSDAETVAAKAKKADEKKAAYLTETPVSDRVVDYLRKAIKAADALGDSDANIALNILIGQYKKSV